jgi:hypothetical protein
MDEAEQTQADAKDKLHVAIMEYHGTVNPDAFVTGWTLITSKESVDMHSRGVSSVSVLPQTDQPFYHTTGMLTHALDHARSVERE